MTEQWQELKETIIEMRDNDGTLTQQKVCKFLANYMEVLEKQMQEPCENCISRQKALDCFEQTNTRQGAKYAIETLPSVTPQRPKGKWNFIGDQMLECSSCKRAYTQTQFEELRIYTTDDLLPKYCPNCGAEMSEGVEDEEKSL